MQIAHGKDCIVEFDIGDEKDGLIDVSIHVKPADENSSVGVGHYRKVYEAATFHEKHHINFVNKFLHNPEYRAKFFRGGVEWDGVISEKVDYKNTQDLTKYQKDSKIEDNAGTFDIHPRCAEMIVRLNRMDIDDTEEIEKALRKLKSYGLDGFSYLTEDELVLMVSKEAIDEVCRDDRISGGSKEFIEILQWIARGLKPDLAIRKVLQKARTFNE